MDFTMRAYLGLVRPLSSRGSSLDSDQHKEEGETPMKAAVLPTLGKPPRFEESPDPKPSQGEVIVHVKAAGSLSLGR